MSDNKFRGVSAHKDGGYAKTAEAKANASSEVIWFSPGCIRPGDGDLLELSDDQ